MLLLHVWVALIIHNQEFLHPCAVQILLVVTVVVLLGISLGTSIYHLLHYQVALLDLTTGDGHALLFWYGFTRGSSRFILSLLGQLDFRVKIVVKRILSLFHNNFIGKKGMVLSESLLHG